MTTTPEQIRAAAAMLTDTAEPGLPNALFALARALSKYARALDDCNELKKQDDRNKAKSNAVAVHTVNLTGRVSA